MILNSFKKTFAADEISAFERLAVSEDLSGSFIHTSFIQEGDVLTAIYEYDGYLRISQCRFREQIQLINLIEKVLVQLEKVEQFYISPDAILLSCDNIFYRPQDEDVRVAYILEESTDLRQSLIGCCSELKERFAGDSISHFEEFCRFLEEGSFTVEELKDEISYIRRRMKEI